MSKTKTPAACAEDVFDLMRLEFEFEFEFKFENKFEFKAGSEIKLVFKPVQVGASHCLVQPSLAYTEPLASR